MNMKALISKLGTWLCFGLSAFFLPIVPAMSFIVVLVFADTITGIMKAGKSNVENVQSRKIAKIIPKVGLYLLFLIVCHSATYFWPSIPFVQLCLGGIAFIEVKSIDENFREITGYSFIDKVLEGFKKLKQFERK